MHLVVTVEFVRSSKTLATALKGATEWLLASVGANMRGEVI